MTKPIYILNGPNLNRLGKREPKIYGSTTLGEIESACNELGHSAGIAIVFKQTNLEGELVSWVQEASDAASALIINAAAYTHTSVALLDALQMLEIPSIEVHLSNPAAREAFRQVNYVSPAVKSGVFGFGAIGYDMALIAVIKTLKQAN
jgi:3-dehydroquinate dehydratase-2